MTTRSGSSPPAANALKRSTASTPSARPTPWYASEDGVKRSLTTTLPAASAGRITLGDVRGAIGEHQQELGARVELPVFVQQQRADLFADGRVAGFVRQHGRASEFLQPAHEPLRLRALAGAFAALEHDEPARAVAPSRVRASRPGAIAASAGAPRDPRARMTNPPSQSARRTPGSEIVTDPSATSPPTQ